MSDIVPLSANELLDRIQADIRNRIQDGEVQIKKEHEAFIAAKQRAAREKKINEHYEALAKTALEKLWKECEKRTGHRKDPREQYLDARVWSCMFCAKPCAKPILANRYDQKSRKVTLESAIELGIEKVARQLRQADIAAGIEWHP